MDRMNPLRQAYLDWPSEISIETFAKCNARCTFCPYPTIERIGTKMSDAMLDRIIEELKDHPGAFMISPFKLNEPFLDKRVIPFLRKVNAELPNAYLRLFSNGSTITPRLIADIAALDRVVHYWISLNDHDPVRYHETMGLRFEDTAAKLDTLHDAVSQGGFGHPVVLSKVRESSVRDVEFVSYVRNRWPLFGSHLIKRDSWLGFTADEGLEVPDAPCGRWFELNITATGKVALCCMDGEAKFSIGDLNEQSLFEVYNGKGWRERRLKMLSRKAVHPCSTCSY